MTTTLIVSGNAGTRGTAQQLVAETPVNGTDYILDFTDCLSAAHGFCDELVKQVTEVRGGTIVKVIGTSVRARSFLELAMRLRGVPYAPGLSAPESVQRLHMPYIATTAEAARELAATLAPPYFDVVLDFAETQFLSHAFVETLLDELHPRVTVTALSDQPSTHVLMDAVLRSARLTS